MSDVPKSHPRYTSLKLRDKITYGVESGLTNTQGLIAHGRGEAFDYLIGEKTTDAAMNAVRAAASLLLKSKHPVISVNGNAIALAAQELANLANELEAPCEVNIFHSSKSREFRIARKLKECGAKNVLEPGDEIIESIDSNRKFVNPEGIAKADVIFVPLEDGDRTEALISAGKKVITIDLNPKSRSATKATITIVDNLVRALPLLIEEVKQKKINKIDEEFNNQENLKVSCQDITKSFT